MLYYKYTVEQTITGLHHTIFTIHKSIELVNRFIIFDKL